MPRLGCCVVACRGKGVNIDPSVTLIPFPQDAHLAEEWKSACSLPPNFLIKPLTRICSRHFRTGKRSLNPDSEDYIPSVFEDTTPINQRSYCPSCRKITITCPCKVIAAVQQSANVQYEDDDSGDEDNNGGGGEYEEEEVDEEEDEEEEEEEPEQEDIPDDGEVLDSDDVDWTPAAETETKTRRSSRPRKRRRNSSSSGSSDEEGSNVPEAPSPPKVVKKEVSPKKENTVTPSKPATTVTPGSNNTGTTPKPRGRRGKNANASNATPIAIAPAPAQTTPPTLTKVVPATFSTRVGAPNNTANDEKTAAKIKELEMDYAMKLEKIQRNHNMRYANLKEEHVQVIHRMKIEWELEKANLLSQIEYYKETMNHKTDEEPMNPFNGGQPIIILPQPDQDEN